MEKKWKRNWKLVGYCEDCKEPVYYDWDNDEGSSFCGCDRRTTARMLLKKQKEEEESE